MIKINLSKEAKNKILNLQEKDKNKYLKISIKKSGCAGSGYLFEWTDDLKSDDILFENILVIQKNAIEIINNALILFYVYMVWTLEKPVKTIN